MEEKEFLTELKFCLLHGGENNNEIVGNIALLVIRYEEDKKRFLEEMEAREIARFGKDN